MRSLLLAACLIGLPTYAMASPNAFTPQIVGCNGGAPTAYTFQFGTYEKVTDGLVHFHFGIGIAGKGTMSGICTGIALPVIPSASKLTAEPSPGVDVGSCNIYWHSNIKLGVGFYTLVAFVGPDDDQAFLYEQGPNVTSDNLPISALGSNTMIYGDCWYRVDENTY
jgi:hypothetical protein